MSTISSLIQQLDGDVTSERPLESAIKLSTHQANKARYVCASAITISISVNIQAQFVPPRVGIEPLAVPPESILLVLLKVSHNYLHRSNSLNVKSEFL